MSYDRKNAGHSLLQERLNEIRMPLYERLVARAHLARAEAIADLIAAAMRAPKALARAVAEWRGRTLAKVG
jgi:acyl-CoA reductase-like NAD-dependent aldehyde dehydrogenase